MHIHKGCLFNSLLQSNSMLKIVPDARDDDEEEEGEEDVDDAISNGCIFLVDICSLSRTSSSNNRVAREQGRKSWHCAKPEARNSGLFAITSCLDVGRRFGDAQPV